MKGYWSGHKVLDPSELEARFSLEDGLGFLDVTGTEDVSEEGRERLRRVRKILDLLPAREADFVELYFFRHLKQTDIASIFRVSQPTVCYRLQRAVSRIQFLLTLPELEDGELENVLNGFLSDPLDVRIMLLMYQTTCQSEVAKQVGVTQGLVRHRFIRTIGRMGWEKVEGEWVRLECATAVGMEKYAEVFKAIADNLNILREVQRPAWGPQVTHSLE